MYIRKNVIYYIKKNIFIILVLIGLCPVLALTYAKFTINSESYRSNEMYISELLYSIKIDNKNTYTIDIEPGETEHTIEITSLSGISTNYKLAYLNNDNLEVKYASDYMDASFGGIIMTRTISLTIKNTSTEKQTLSLMVFGGYSFNEVEDVKVLDTYTEIDTNYLHYDYETTALYVDNVLVDKLDEEKDYTLESYTCSNGSEAEYDTGGKRLIIKGGSKTKCSLYFQEIGYTQIKYSELIANYSCANASAGSNPIFTFTGNCEVLDDSKADEGYWKIRLLSNGQLTFKVGTDLDVFAVGGGGGGAACTNNTSAPYAGGGGGGGYVKSFSFQAIMKQNYTVIIGNGGSGGNASSGGTGGTTSIFGEEALGGKGGTMGTNNPWTSAVGGAGGSGGGGGSYNPSQAYTGGNGGTNGSDGIKGTYTLGDASAGGAGSNVSTIPWDDEESYGRYAGGGGGGGAANWSSVAAAGFGLGGSGGGGNGGVGYKYSSTDGDGNGADGTANTGGGGGGAGYRTVASQYKGGSGGSGIVIIRNTR